MVRNVPKLMNTIFKNNNNSGGGFLPNQIDNNIIWLDAFDESTITKNNNLVSQWNDKSGNNNNALKPSSIQAPLYVNNGLNNKPTLKGYHDNSASTLSISDNATLDYDSFDLFMVLQRDVDSGGEEIILAKERGSNQREIRSFIGGGDELIGRTSSDGSSGTTKTLVQSVNFQPNNPVIYHLSHSNNTLSLSINNGSKLSTTLTGLFNGSSEIGLFSQGSNGAAPFRGCISEIIMFGAKVNTVSEDKLFTYLSDKWGIDL